MFRFRRFSTRLLVLVAGLVALAQIGTYVLVVRANRTNALSRIDESLALGASQFSQRVDERIDDLSKLAAQLSNDYALRQLLLGDTPDGATVRSALETYRLRIDVPMMLLLAPDGSVIGSSGDAPPDNSFSPFRTLLKKAAASENTPRASGYAILPPTFKLYSLLVVPVYAPAPEIAAWVGLAYPIDTTFANRLKQSTQLEVTFLYALVDYPLPVSSTFAAAQAKEVAGQAFAAGEHAMFNVGGEPYVTILRGLPLIEPTPGWAHIALQRSLNAELAPSRRLELFLQVLLPTSLALAALLALWIARGVSQPVQQLAAHTQVIARGDYASRITLDRADELGQLADAMNQMSAGLAERDQVRDLLDKNVSPEVAAQLMRDGSALGGEEREVTILFADLRGFTTLSEKLPPPELLALLNRYLDRMSGAIEAHGGVIDKFIGDAIMALFGAPVAQGDAADRALAAALAMERALVSLNAELAIEAASIDLSPSNGPRRLILQQGLAIGIGVNTARVVAGNIGSHRRLNYSVIGDGVNVAARLQSLTRTAEYRTNIITSAATIAACRRSPSSDLRPPTFRPLGPVQVKGRAEPVEIFALV